MEDQRYRTTKPKPEQVYLNELNSSSRYYIVKVLIAEKGRDILSFKKTVRFQTLLLKDEKMTFGAKTVIQPLYPELGPVEPNYQSILSIPRAIDPDEIYDVVGVLLVAQESPRPIVSGEGGRESLVREIVIIDQRLMGWADRFMVIGFRALKPHTRRGFSMNSGMSNRIIYEPKGERARVSSDWARLFNQRLVDRQARVLNVRFPSGEKKIVSIVELRQKKR
uniref:Uncharacterized protein n=1 Tax=Chenopodium quinoa TaxID=63459 RepID=A0A803LJX7_CHEQI